MSSLSWAQLDPGNLDTSYMILDAAPLEISRREINVTITAAAEVAPNKCLIGLCGDSRTRTRWFGAALDETYVIAGHEMHQTTSGSCTFYQIVLDELALQRQFPSAPDALNLLDIGRGKVVQNAGDANRIRASLDKLFIPILEARRAAQYGPPPRRVYGTLVPLIATALQARDSHSVERSATLTRRLAAVRACEAYMREHADATLLDLSEAAGMESRRLINAFEAVTGYSPMDYLKRLRLNGAYRALLRAHPSQTRITRVATDWGFWHMGHFATDYHAMFGETPSQTLYHS